MDKNTLKYLDVIRALSGDRGLPAEDIAKITGTSTRNVYYLLKAFADYGFIVHHSGGLYSLDPQSPFFQKIVKMVDFTPEQASYLYNILNRESKDNALVGMLQRKLQKFYRLETSDEKESRTYYYKNLGRLQDAIQRRQMVILKNYASSNSNTVSDRTVEPFMFLGHNTDVRAYELKSKMNKTFKLTRIGSVEILDTDWTNEDKHKKVFTDMFMFSGEKIYHIKLRFDVMAHNFMLEEYPHSSSVMTKSGKSHWIFETDVVNYLTIGRFILGLYEDVEVLEGEGLKKYLTKKIEKMSKKIGQKPL